MRIGAVYRPDTVNARYRVAIPMIALGERGHDVHAFPQRYGGEPVPFEQVAACDLVLLHRFIPDEDDTFVKRLKARGVVVVYDNDDDFDALSAEGLRIVDEATEPGFADRVRVVFHRALAQMPNFDLVLTPSETLADRLRAAGARAVRVIDNRLPDYFLDVKEDRNDRVTIGWHAYAEHILDYRDLGLPDVFERLLAENPHIQIVTLGVDLRLPSDRYQAAGLVHFERLTQRLASFDIGIAPLVDNAFNRSRSNCKVREFAAAGVPWLASPVGPYQRLGKAEGGKLVGDGDWHAEISQLIRSPFRRARAGRRAKAWAKREAISQTVVLWEEAFYEALELAGTAEPVV